MKYCKLEKVGTKEYGKMLKRIQILDAGRTLAKEAGNWKIEGQKTRISRNEERRLWNEFETGGVMAQTELWIVAEENVGRQRCSSLRKRISIEGI